MYTECGFESIKIGNIENVRREQSGQIGFHYRYMSVVLGYKRVNKRRDILKFL